MDFDELSWRLANAPRIEGGDSAMTPDEIERLYQSTDIEHGSKHEREALVAALQTYIRARVRNETSGHDTFVLPVVLPADDGGHVVRPYAMRIGRTTDSPELTDAADYLRSRIDELARATGMTVEGPRDGAGDDEGPSTNG